MSKGIYLIQGEKRLVEMREENFPSEGLLQTLIAQHPHILAGDEMGDGEPRRWLLITREMPVPSQQDGPGQWALDHLFLDQDGVPTLVEVKRSTDTRLRREVVGQMLDYAANAVVYWPLDAIRSRFEQMCADEGLDPSERLTTLTGTADPEVLWQLTRTNLEAGRIRMVFVADRIPVELRRIVEFLNGQMDPAEVLAVEIRQYVGKQDDELIRTLVPSVIGQTAPPPPGKWDKKRFLDVLASARSAAVEPAQALMSFGESITGRGVDWGTGRFTGSFSPHLVIGSRRFNLFFVNTAGVCGLTIGWNTISEELSETFRLRAAGLFGSDQFTPDKWARGNPSVDLDRITKTELDRLMELVTDFVLEIRASQLEDAPVSSGTATPP